MGRRVGFYRICLPLILGAVLGLRSLRAVPRLRFSCPARMEGVILHDLLMLLRANAIDLDGFGELVAILDDFVGVANRAPALL
jgi:hypothetical protein